MNYLGEDGYLKITRRVLAIRQAIEDGVRGLGFQVWGEPKLSILTYGAADRDIDAVADHLSTKGWFVGHITEPPGLHLMLNLTHENVVSRYLEDLKVAASAAASGRRTSRMERTY